MKINATVSKLLTNKYVLSIVFVMTLLNIFGYLMLGNTDAIIYFILIGFITRFFSKNMIIILGIPLLLVNFISASKKTSNYEGMETQGKNSSSTNSSKQSDIEKIKKHSSTTGSLPITPPHDDSMSIPSAPGPASSSTDESFEVGRKKGKYNIDYASTVEEAYDELNKIIGGDGIKRLTQDTQGLMNQQLQLAEAMKSMGPLIQGMAPLMSQAKGLLEGMGQEGGLGNIAEMAKKFTSSLPGQK